MRYKLIQVVGHEKFQADVNNAIAHGWKLQGGVATAVIDREMDDGRAYQEMVFTQALVSATPGARKVASESHG